MNVKDFFCGKLGKIVSKEDCNIEFKECDNRCKTKSRKRDSDSGEFKEGGTEQSFS